MVYDDENIFGKILRGELPCNKIYEDVHVVAFHDIKPQTKIHALIVPKGQYTDMSDFSQNASDAEIVGFSRGIHKIAEYLGVEETGYRLISNTGQDGNQEVAHFHIHIMGGEQLGSIIPKN